MVIFQFSSVLRNTVSVTGFSILVCAIFASSCDVLDTNDSPGERDTTRTERTSNVEWKQPVNVDLDLARLPKRPSIVVSGSARYVTFQVDDTTAGESIPKNIFMTRWENGEWHDPVQISQSDVPSSRPVLEMGPDGRLHVVWGERLEDVSSRPGGFPHSAFYSVSADGGRTWATPEKIFESRTDRLFHLPRSIAFDTQGHPHLVLGSKEKENRPSTIKHFERRDDGWTGGRTSLGGRAGGGFPDIAITPDGTLLVSYVSADTTENNDKNTIFLATSPDGGETWNDGTTIGNENVSPARFPRVVADGQHVHVVWLDDENAERGAELMFANRSTDGGATWGTPTQIAGLENGAFDPQEIAVGEEGIHVSASRDGFGLETYPTDYLNSTPASGWSEKTSPFKLEVTSSHPGLSTRPPGEIHVAIAGRDESGDLDNREGLFYVKGVLK